MASAFSFGSSPSSLPNTSYLNISDPVSSGGFSGAPLGGSGMIDPGTATLIATGVSSLGSAVGGAASGKGAKSAATQAKEAAAEQAKMVVQANRENLLGGFGLEDLSQKQELAFGGPRERAEEFANQQFSSAMDAGPGSYQRGIVTMARNLAARQAETEPFRRTGFTPMSRYT
jgi:hypothetical protein